jgi:hypothetical protein
MNRLTDVLEINFLKENVLEKEDPIMLYHIDLINGERHFGHILGFSGTPGFIKFQPCEAKEDGSVTEKEVVLINSSSIIAIN